MALTIQNTDIIVAFGDAIDLAAGDDLFVTQGTIVASGDGHGIDANTVGGDNGIHIEGTVIGGGTDNALQVSTNSSVTITATGTLTAFGIGGLSTLHLRDGGNSLVNSGTITSSGGMGVNASGGDNHITNFGTISGLDRGILFQIGTEADTLVNHGLISAGDGAGDALSSDVGINMNKANVRVENHGTIAVSGAESAAIYAAYTPATNDTAQIVNTGEITSSHHGIRLDLTVDIDIVNSGLISATSAAILGNDVNNHVRNTGTIIGDVDLGDGTDTFDTRGGTVIGEVRGGPGSDTYYVDDASVVIVEELLEGFDTVYSTTSYTLGDNLENLLLIGPGDLRGEGNAWGNVITGGLGDDTLSGASGNDNLNGGFGADRLDGGEGIDLASYFDSAGWVNISLLTGFVGGGPGSHAVGDSFVSIENLRGSVFADRLNGDHGANFMRGDAGDDMLRGRGGADTLNGDSGRDTADYEDSPAFVNISLLTGFMGGGTGAHSLGDTLISIENLTGSQFADRLNGDNGNNVLQGRLGADTLDGNGGEDTADYSGSGAFVNVSLLTGFTGGGSGSHATGDVLEEIENLTGSAHDDILNGDNDANTLAGLGGNDLLRGNGGADQFVFETDFGQDTVADFQDGVDVLNLSRVEGYSSFDDLAITDTAAGAEIRVIGDDGGNVILLSGVSASALDVGDFAISIML